MQRRAVLWLVVTAAFGIYHFDVVIGQIKFNDLCKREGGPRFLAPVEVDQGWEVSGGPNVGYEYPFEFGRVAFVRYKDKSGVQRDVIPAPRQPGKWPEYMFSAVDLSKTVRYRHSYRFDRFPDDDRFAKITRQVTDLRTGQVVASYTSFRFRWTKPERVILAAPTGQGCWDQQSEINSFTQNLYRPILKQ